MPHLFEPWRLCGLEFSNRIMVSPMCQYSCRDGMANDWHLVHLGSRAVGGAALVMAEATAVTADGRISPEDLGLWNDAQMEPLRRIFTFIEEQGAVPAIQLAHAGRQASASAPWKGGRPLPPGNGAGGWSPIFAPSAIPFAAESQVPRELTVAEIASIVRAFGAAATRAQAAGAKVVEIHAAHGYLLHSFLSPLSNHRADAYGGPLPNRARMLCEVVAAVRNAWPERWPLFVRISSTDWAEGGWTIEDSIALAKMLKSLGVDLVDCSSGGILPHPAIPLGPGYQAPFAQRVRHEAGIATGAVGLITGPEQADHIIRTGQADAVLLARAMLRDPYWPLHAAHALGEERKWPAPYERAKPRW